VTAPEKTARGWRRPGGWSCAAEALGAARRHGGTGGGVGGARGSPGSSPHLALRRGRLRRRLGRRRTLGVAWSCVGGLGDLRGSLWWRRAGAGSSGTAWGASPARGGSGGDDGLLELRSVVRAWCGRAERLESFQARPRDALRGVGRPEEARRRGLRSSSPFPATAAANPAIVDEGSGGFGEARQGSVMPRGDQKRR